MLKNRYEGSGGQFASESSRIMPISSVGEKRKSPEMEGGNGGSNGSNKLPLGMWDAFGDDISRFGYSDTKDMFLDSTSGVIPKP